MREHNYLPATFNDRIHAMSIDFGLLAFIVLVMIFMNVGILNLVYVKYAIILVFWYLIFIVPNYVKKGSSLGKNNSDIIVLTEDYKEVSILTMHLRETFILVFSFVTAGLYPVVGFALLDKRIDKRAIHDIICKTRVVRKTPFVGKS